MGEKMIKTCFYQLSEDGISMSATATEEYLVAGNSHSAKRSLVTFDNLVKPHQMLILLEDGTEITFHPTSTGMEVNIKQT